jgi:phage gpG-like protein
VSVITASVDLTQVMRSLARAAKAGKDLRPVWKAMRPLLKADLADHAQKQQGPDGAWPRRAASSTAKIIGATGGLVRLRGGRSGPMRMRKRTLRRLSQPMLGRFRLPNTYQWSMTGQALRATSRVEWSGIHQEGGRAGRGALIKARPFAWASDGLVDAAVVALRTHLTEAAGAK